MVSKSQFQVYEHILTNYTTELELKDIEIEELQKDGMKIKLTQNLCFTHL